MLSSFTELLPAGAEKVFIALGGVVGGMLSFAFGSVGPLLIWLTVFIVADIVTGWLAARAQHSWRSSRLFLGMLKKAVMFAIVALSHGLDQLYAPLIGVSFFQSITICAYAAGEFGSIIENLEKAGLGGAVPPVLRSLIRSLENRVEGKADAVLASHGLKDEGGKHDDTRTEK